MCVCVCSFVRRLQHNLLPLNYHCSVFPVLMVDMLVIEFESTLTGQLTHLQLNMLEFSPPTPTHTQLMLVPVQPSNVVLTTVHLCIHMVYMPHVHSFMFSE